MAQNNKRQKITRTAHLPVEIEIEPVGDKPFEMYGKLARSIFGQDYEVGKVKIKKGEVDKTKITLLQVQRDFTLEQLGRNNRKETIDTYNINFNRIFDFFGFEYLKQGKEIVDYVIEHIDEYGSARQIGASMPVIVFELDNIIAYYRDYLTRVKKLAEHTVLSALRQFRTIVYFCQERYKVKEFSITIRNIPAPIKPVFSQYELEKLNKAPNKEDFVQYRDWVMIQYLAATGNRISSMLELNVGSIDFEMGSITVNRQKNREPKLMPLNRELRKILERYIYHYRCDEKGTPLFDEPLFIERTGSRLTYSGARASMQRYFKKHGVSWEGFHKFRHSYAAYWIRDGGNPFMLKEQLGHKTLEMTNRYANIYGLATKDEAEAHSLSNQMPQKQGRKSVKFRK